MENIVNKNINDNYSTLIECENSILLQNIEILKSLRETLWNSVIEGTSAFLITCLDGIYEVKEEMSNFRQYASIDVYKKFIREYDMTMFLLQKCLIDSTNKDLLPSDEFEKAKIKDLISKIGMCLQDNHMEDVVSALRLEDPTIYKTLEALGLPKEKIEEIIATGYKVNSVLDVQPNSNLGR